MGFMPTPRFNTYYRYDDLSSLLHAYADEYPNLVQIESIGKSYEGRDVWLLTITNIETGEAREKARPVGGRQHPRNGSFTLNGVPLPLIHAHEWLRRYDADITRCLDTRTLYLCPRVNPDGAEWALADQPKIIRSSTRPYPYDEDALSGLVREDVDGDGRMLMMRFKDESGALENVSKHDPRLLVRREPAETGGMYYRVLPEGNFRKLRRNNAKDEARQGGFRPQPQLSLRVAARGQAEGRRALSDVGNRKCEMWWTSSRIIRILQAASAFTRTAAFFCAPSSHQPDEAMPAEDLWTFEKIGQKGTELTGYPNVSVYHDFRYHPKEVMTGAFDDWLFDHLGMYSAGRWRYGVRRWRRASKGASSSSGTESIPVEDDLKLLEWSDEVLEGQGYVDWYSFEHPQLGEVELGGWNMLYAFRNPPPQLLENANSQRFPQWAIWHLLISPKLELLTTDERTSWQRPLPRQIWSFTTRVGYQRT